MQIQRVGLNTVELAVSSLLGLALVEVALSARLAVQLLDFVGMNVEQVAVVGLLVGSRKASKDNHMVIRDLEQATALQANPICILFDLEVQGLPMDPVLQVKLFYKVGSLAAVKPSYYVKVLVFESESRVEVSSGIQVGDLSPRVSVDIIHLAFVHAFWWQRAANSEDLALLLFN